jgi:acyl-CoA synthetase (AMP-forming)/AMP-acid ligase II
VTELPESFVPVGVADGVRASARRSPGKVALREGSRELAYRELVERIDRVGNGVLAGLGLRPGDHAALMSPNCLEFAEVVLGLASVGVAPAMVNYRSTASELAFVCDDAGARVLFVHADLEELARSAELASVERIVVIGGDYDEWLAQASPGRPDVRVEEWDVFCIPYTAGTTGNPKGVLLPHRSRSLTFFAMGVEFGCYTPVDHALGIAPMFHGAGFAFSVAPIFFGGQTTIMPRFDPEQVLRLLAEHRCTNAFMVPTFFSAIFALGDEALRRHDTSALRTIVSNAAPLSQALKERIVEHFGEGVLFECYGSTEASIVTSLRPEDQLRKEQCVGQPFPCTEIRLLDEDGEEVEPGEIGEVFSRSPFHFNGYWKQPEQTAAHFRDGFLSVGDLGRLDDEGYLYLVDRKDDKIVSGGVNVHPREVENVLADHPAVAEAAAFAVPDPYLGEAIRASVALRPGASADADALREFCSRRLPRHKRPQAIDIVERLPRTPAGKILRRELREPFWAGHERRIS